jgi:hypothetical protein
MQTVTTSHATIDLDALPDEAQRELVEFYEFLVFKYHRQGALPHLEDAQAQPDQTTPRTCSSKWATIVQRVQNDPVHLAGYAERLKKDMREFRNHFEFQHDQEP